MKIKKGELVELTSNYSYLNDGDYYEKEFAKSIVDHFPNSEVFWLKFITPATYRIDTNIADSIQQIQIRDELSKDLFDLFVNHHSMFKNLVYASECIRHKHLSYFSNFYSHLGTICDLAEEFITQLYFVTLICECKKTSVLQELTEAQFVSYAIEWYKKHYSNSFEHYLSKGKTAPIKIIGRSNILDEYLNGSAAWLEYKRFSLLIRTYRNIVVHNSEISGRFCSGKLYVPKKEKILQYKKWYQIKNVSQEIIENDFMEINQQMQDDFYKIKKALNDLWEIPISHFNKLFYEELNPNLLNKYFLTIE